MDDLALTVWAVRYNDRLGGVFTQFLLGNHPITPALVEALEALYERRDLSDIHTLLEEVIEKSLEDEVPVKVGFLEVIQKMVKEKMDLTTVAKPDKRSSQGGPGVLSHWEILTEAHKGMIRPLSPTVEGPLGHGLITDTYVACLGADVALVSNIGFPTLDPLLATPPGTTQTIGKEGFFILRPHGYAVCQTLESFHLPEDIFAHSQGLVEYLKNGVLIHCPRVLPGHAGPLTLGIQNVHPVPVKVYAGKGICQITFSRTV